MVPSWDSLVTKVVVVVRVLCGSRNGAGCLGGLQAGVSWEPGAPCSAAGQHLWVGQVPVSSGGVPPSEQLSGSRDRIVHSFVI